MFVGADESIKNLETYRGYLAQLADPRKISDAQAKEIVAKAKPIYHLSGGLHSGEVGPSEMLMELAYRIAVGGLAAGQEDSRQRHRLDHAGRRSRRPRSQRRLVLQVRHQRDRRAARPAPACRTGASTSSTTTTATSTTRRSKCARCSTGTCSGTRRSCTTCIRRRRCSTPSAARRRRIRISIRFSTASCR